MKEESSGNPLEKDQPLEKNQLTATRKQDHIDLCCSMDEQVEMTISSGFEDICFIHRALPECNFNEIALSVEFLNHEFAFPIFLSSMTGGTKEAKEINQKLAIIAEQLNIGMGVGSQRAALLNPNCADSFSIVRETAPSAFIAANLGAAQFIKDFDLDHAQQAIDMISADALILHLNPLQEVIQPEGNAYFKGLFSCIEELCDNLEVPVILKEVGSGIAYEEAKELVKVGVEGIEIAGAGGTSWAKIEALRAKTQGIHHKHLLGELFSNWGMPTAISTIEVCSAVPEISIISSGGIRNGLQAAKAIAIGADLVGMALPIIRKVKNKDDNQLLPFMEQFLQELKTAMFLVGAESLDALKRVPIVIHGKTAEWLEARDIDLDFYAENDDDLELF
ncbi:MAG: type 2 isopentenyl-diphosphate Delta-isomerase [Candidatus Heimdallarchaeota archaeon]|nr:type 2 isopentenyl-diphosphate Delta-isomerase [Candidatus Heimdallarchaeota archaeon]